jgi:hypothetical protein
MNILAMIVTCLNIILLLGLSFHVFIRVKEKKEDQRITKGLQLLQHKISILQDLSDKADEQVQRLVHVLDNKSTELRKITTEANIAMNGLQIEINAATNTTAITAQAADSRANQMSDNIKLDEFSQFVEALNIQNEKAKPVLQAQKNVPQDFILNDKPTEAVSIVAVKNQIRPFEFRRLNN